jgi:uncharacterized protein (DUF927 family)
MSGPDFAEIHSRLIPQAESLLPSWLPGGQFRGPEYVTASTDGGQGRSLSVNTTTGAWSDFATGERGGDMVSLFAAIHGLSQGDAAKKLAQDLGLDNPKIAARRQVKQQVQDKPKAAPWQPILPVPGDAPAPDFRHFKDGMPSKTWTYHDGAGKVLGHVARFDHADGSKDIRPMTFCVGPDGKQEWRWQAFAAPRPLYGLDRLAKGTTSPIMLVEGEKAADAAQALLPKVVCVTWPGGSNAQAKAGFAPLAGRRVCIWPDADGPGVLAGLEVAALARKAGAAEVSIVVPPQDVAQGWDLADATSEGWTGKQVGEWIKAHRKCPAEFWAEVRERFTPVESEKRARFEERAAKALKEDGKPGASSPAGKPGSGPRWFPFSMRVDGVYFLEEDKDGGVSPVWVCSPLRVVALTRDAEGKEWGRLLELEDKDGRTHRWPMPMSLCAGTGDTYRAQLLSLGLRLAPGRKAAERLHMFLTLASPEDRARCVDRIGWHGRCFVLADAVHGSEGGAEEVMVQGLTEQNMFQAAGTLAEWQEHVGSLCPGNSRLVFAVSCALAAPLLHLTGQESGGFHFVGGSSLGKTTMLHAAGSVCGGGGIGGFIRQWRATDNGLEAVAASHCDSLLCLDEMGQAVGKVAGEVAYMLANGQGKSRAGRDGQARASKQWRVLFLSTGEVTLADKVKEDGRGRAMAGQAVRVVDIPADAGAGLGAWEDLHGHPDGGRFSQAIKEASGRYYGTALRTFLERLTAGLDAHAGTVSVLLKDFQARHCPPGADGQVSRVLGRFALVAAAGELGAVLGVLPWPRGEAERAAVACFKAWLGRRGGVGAGEVLAGLAQVRAFFEAHGSSRFEDLGADTERPVINRAGYRKKGLDGRTRFLVLPEAFRSEICRGLDHETVCRELAKLGFLEKNDRHMTKVERVRGERFRVYVVLGSILGGDAEQGMPENGGDSGDSGYKPETAGKNTVTTTPGASGDSGDRAAQASLLDEGVTTVTTSETGCGDRKSAYNSGHVTTVTTVTTENNQGVNSRPGPGVPTDAGVDLPEPPAHALEDGPPWEDGPFELGPPPEGLEPYDGTGEEEI